MWAASAFEWLPLWTWVCHFKGKLLKNIQESKKWLIFCYLCCFLCFYDITKPIILHTDKLSYQNSVLKRLASDSSYLTNNRCFKSKCKNGVAVFVSPFTWLQVSEEGEGYTPRWRLVIDGRSRRFDWICPKSKLDISGYKNFFSKIKTFRMSNFGLGTSLSFPLYFYIVRTAHVFHFHCIFILFGQLKSFISTVFLCCSDSSNFTFALCFCVVRNAQTGISENAFFYPLKAFQNESEQRFDCWFWLIQLGFDQTRADIWCVFCDAFSARHIRRYRIFQGLFFFEMTSDVFKRFVRLWIPKITFFWAKVEWFRSFCEDR